MSTSKGIASQRKHSWSCLTFLKNFQTRLPHSSKERNISWKRTKNTTATDQQNSRVKIFEDGSDSANETSESKHYAPFSRIATNDVQTTCFTKPSELQKMRNLLMLFRHKIPQDTVISLFDALKHLEELSKEELNTDLESDDELEIPTERTVGDHMKMINNFVAENDFGIEEKVRKKEDFSEKDTNYLDSEMLRRMINRKHFREYLAEVKKETKKDKKKRFKNGNNESDAFTESSQGGDDVIKSLGIVENGVYFPKTKTDSQCMHDGIQQIANMIDVCEKHIMDIRLKDLDDMIDDIERTDKNKRTEKCKRFIEDGLYVYYAQDLRSHHKGTLITIPAVHEEILYDRWKFFAYHPRTSVFKERHKIYGKDSSPSDVYGKSFIGVYFDGQAYIGHKELAVFCKDFVIEKLDDCDHFRQFDYFYARFING